MTRVGVDPRAVVETATDDNPERHAREHGDIHTLRSIFEKNGRMTKQFVDAAEESASKDAVSGLSQLVARILAQLSLSAWLPAAALVLLTSLLLKLGEILNEYRQAVVKAAPNQVPSPPSIGEWFAEGIRRMGTVDVPQLLLMAVAVVVLTMLTQAFAFEAIRVLEGYWSPFFAVEWIANGCCLYFRERLRIVRRRERILIRSAWTSAERVMRKMLKERALGKEWSKRMIDRLRSEVLAEGRQVELSEQEASVVDDYNWRQHAPRNKLRRLRNIEKKLADYPSVGNLMPTRLGNVLRHFEEDTEVENIESMVDEVYDLLPFSLQISHDSQRGRLDLYCSMTFVWLFITILGVALLGPGPNLPYTVAYATTGVVAALLTYRAAISSARYYGSLLLVIAEHRPKPAPEMSPTKTSWWRRAIQRAPLGP